MHKSPTTPPRCRYAVGPSSTSEMLSTAPMSQLSVATGAMYPAFLGVPDWVSLLGPPAHRRRGSSRSGSLGPFRRGSSGSLHPAAVHRGRGSSRSVPPTHVRRGSAGSDSGRRPHRRTNGTPGCRSSAPRCVRSSRSPAAPKICSSLTQLGVPGSIRPPLEAEEEEPRNVVELTLKPTTRSDQVVHPGVQLVKQAWFGESPGPLIGFALGSTAPACHTSPDEWRSCGAGTFQPASSAGSARIPLAIQLSVAGASAMNCSG